MSPAMTSPLFLPSISSPPPCFGLRFRPPLRVRCVSSPLSLQFDSLKQLKGSSKHTTAFLHRSVERGSFVLQLKHVSSSHFCFNPETCMDCSGRPCRSVIARSDLVHDGIPDSTYSSVVNFMAKARGVCFYAVTSITALFLIVLMIIGHPFVLILDPFRRKFQHLVAKIWASLTIAPFFKVEIVGLENLPGSDVPAVYVSNHQSFLDIYTLLTLGRNFKFISKTSIFALPVIGWAMFFLGVIPLKRMDSRSQLECLKRCIDLIKGGASVFFFPEGTRSKDGKLGTFKKGAFSVAAKTGVPVVPITILGTGNIMPSGQEGLLYSGSGSVKIVIHRPLELKDPVELCAEAREVIARTLDCEG